MNLLPGRVTLGVALLEGGCAYAIVRRTPTGAAVLAHGVVMPLQADAVGVLAEVVRSVGGVSRAVVVAPPSASFVRAVALDRAAFLAARDDVMQTVGDVLPVHADSALVGFIARAPEAVQEEPSGGRGYLCAVDQGRTAEPVEWVRRASGVQPTLVTATMVLPALGLQTEAYAAVAQESPMGAVRHELRHGLPAKLDVPVRGDEVLTLPASMHGDAAHAAGELAVAAALVESVAGRFIVPAGGRVPRRLPAWSKVAAVLALAAVLGITALSTRGARYEAATQDLREQQSSRTQAIERVSAARAELIAMNQRLEAARLLRLGERRSVLPDLLALHEALPEGAALNQFILTPTGVELSGFAVRASTVLENIDASARFDGARSTESPQLMQIDGEQRETFAVRAEILEVGR